MPSNYTPLGFNKQASGENENTWGEVLNDEAIELIDQAIRGRTAFALSGARTLTATNGEENEARSAILHVTSGTGGTVTIPGLSKLYLVINQASGDVTVSCGGATSALIGPGDVMLIACDGVAVRGLGFAGVSLRQYVDALAFSSVNLPAQAGQGGKFIKTDGSTASWQRVAAADISDFNTSIKGLAVALAVAL